MHIPVFCYLINDMISFFLQKLSLECMFKIDPASPGNSRSGYDHDLWWESKKLMLSWAFSSRNILRTLSIKIRLALQTPTENLTRSEQCWVFRSRVSWRTPVVSCQLSGLTIWDIPLPLPPPPDSWRPALPRLTSVCLLPLNSTQLLQTPDLDQK